MNTLRRVSLVVCGALAFAATLAEAYNVYGSGARMGTRGWRRYLMSQESTWSLDRMAKSRIGCYSLPQSPTRRGMTL